MRDAVTVFVAMLVIGTFILAIYLDRENFFRGWFEDDGDFPL